MRIIIDTTYRVVDDDGTVHEEEPLPEDTTPTGASPESEAAC